MSLRLNGSTSGYSEIDAPAIAGDQTFTLPANGGLIQTVGRSLTLGTAQASTSGTAIDFNDIPSWVKRITVMFNGVSTNGASDILVRLGGSGGIEATGYIGTVGVMANAFVTAGSFSTGFLFTAPSAPGAAGAIWNGVFTFTLLDSASNLWAASGTNSRTDATGAYTIAGTKALSGVLDRVRITTANGTDAFDAGSINILYEG